MAQSIREQILQSLVLILKPVANNLGANLVRSPTVAIDRAASPALLIFPESDLISQRTNDRVERHLLIKVLALARAANGEAPETRNCWSPPTRPCCSSPISVACVWISRRWMPTGNWRTPTPRSRHSRRATRSPTELVCPTFLKEAEMPKLRLKVTHTHAKKE